MKRFCVICLVWCALIPCAAIRAQHQRVAEFFENPVNPTSDDMDTVTAANQDGVAHPVIRVATGLAGTGVIDTIIAASPFIRAENIYRGLSGLAWGGRCAAIPVTGGGSHAIGFYNIENSASATFVNSQVPLGPGQGAFRNSLIAFVEHSQQGASNFPNPYNEETGSYIYTLFSSNPSGTQAIDARNGTFKIALSNSLALGVPIEARFQIFRYLVQTTNAEGAKMWWRSDDQIASEVSDLTPDNLLTGVNSNNITPTTRESLMTRHYIIEMKWERVSIAAELDMNELNDGGEVPLGPKQTSPSAPALDKVTGMGVLVNKLSPVKVLNYDGLRPSIAIYGLLITEDGGKKNSIPTHRWAAYE